MDFTKFAVSKYTKSSAGIVQFIQNNAGGGGRRLYEPTTLSGYKLYYGCCMGLPFRPPHSRTPAAVTTKI